MDDIGVKGPRIIYNNEEVAPGIRRYMLEYIMWLNSVLADLERAGCTISSPKSQFCMPGIRIVGFVCNYLGKHPNSAKVIKIVKWAEPLDVSQARVFIRIVVYYRVFVKDFATVAAPIYTLMKKNIPFL